MPSNAPPSPFPFLPVVLESPTGPQGRAILTGADAEGTVRSADKATHRPVRGKGRAVCRGEGMPGLSLDDAVAALRVEVVRRLDPAGVALLGAIVR